MVGPRSRLAAAIGCTVITAAMSITAGCTRPSPERSKGGDIQQVQRKSQVFFVKLHETTLRKYVKGYEMPAYPPLSVQAGAAGVAVASVNVTPVGTVRNVDVLQAPDVHISEAVREALLRWTFTPVQPDNASEPTPATGKLTFYFQIVDGKGHVVNATDLSSVKDKRASVGDHGPVRRIAASEVQKMTSRDAPPIIVDIRDREAYSKSHMNGAVNVPLEELTVRSAEFSGAASVMIDCNGLSNDLCNAGAKIVTSSGVSNVMVIDR